MKKFILSIILGVSTTTLLVLFVLNYINQGYNELWFLIAVIALTIIFIVVLTLSIWYYYREQTKILKLRLDRWSKVAPRVSQVGDDTFNELPVGVIVLDEFADEIKWVNNYANQIFKTELIEQFLADISPELLSVVRDGRVKKIIEVNQNFYDVIYKPDLQVIYLFDATRYMQIENKYENQIPALGFVSLDNFDVIMQQLDLTDQSSIRGEYLSEIIDWAEKFNAYLKPLSDDRFLIISYRHQLNKMMEEQFTILETIREISFKHKIAVSISVGLVSWEVSYPELSTLAQRAIELAEKRGGDQIVVNIQNEQIKYFGAKSESQVKQSRVSARVNAKTLKDYFANTEKLFVMGHAELDLDSFGSMIAITKMALAANTEHIYMVLDIGRIDETTKGIIEYLEKLKHPILKHLITTNEALSLYDEESILVIVDTQQANIVHSPELLETDMERIVIDHHRSNENPIGSSFSYTDSSSSSTIEMLIELIGFYEEKVDIDEIEASIMYGGIIVDTDNFTFRTSAKTFETAAKLKDYGLDIVLVKSFLRNDLASVVKINDIVKEAEIIYDNFAVAVNNEKTNDRSFLAKTSQHLLSIKGIEAAFTIGMVSDDVIAISARSLGKINVQLIMEALGGGGHLTSAATQIKNSTIEKVKKELSEILSYQKEEGEDQVKVILLEDVKGRGRKDDVVDLPNGYANFLISSKKAVMANEEALDSLEKQKQERQAEEARKLQLLHKLSDEITGKSINLSILVGKDGRRFGSITTKQITEKFYEEHGVLIDRKKIEVVGDINAAGIYSVKVNLGSNIVTDFQVNVIEESRA